MRTRSTGWLLSALGGIAWAFVGLAVSGRTACAQRVTRPETVLAQLPLQEAIELLEQRYSAPVTFESPLGEATYTYSMVVPEDLTPDKTQHLDEVSLTSMLDAYHEQNPGAARFRVLRSKLGLHIIPTQARDATGALVPGGSLLDVRISVPVQSRTASEHVAAISHGLTVAGGMPVGANTEAGGFDDAMAYLHRQWDVAPPRRPVEAFRATWFDQIFAANAYTLRVGSLRSTMAPHDDADERPYMLFEWGAKDTTAREALIDLIGRSASSVTWRVEYAEGICWLYLAQVPAPAPAARSVGAARNPHLYLDRCNACRPAPVQH